MLEALASVLATHAVPAEQNAPRNVYLVFLPGR